MATTNPIYYAFVIVCVFLGFFSIIGLLLIQRKEYKDLLEGSDLLVGVYYKSKQDKLDLEFTEEEIKELNKNTQDELSTYKQVYIYSTVPKTKRKVVVFISILMLFIGIVVVTSTSPEERIYAGFIFLIIVILFTLWAGFCIISKDILDNEKFIRKRLFYRKVYPIKDIKLVKYTKTKFDIYGIIIVDKNNKEVANFVPLEKNNDQLLVGFKRLGVFVDKYE